LKYAIACRFAFELKVAGIPMKTKPAIIEKTPNFFITVLTQNDRIVGFSMKKESAQNMWLWINVGSDTKTSFRELLSITGATAMQVGE
jgi:hypothetical protein